MPSPAASAHALPWGTPGHGRGSRSRHTPGRTRSPRPTSFGRGRSLTRRDVSVRAPLVADDTRTVAQRYFDALARRDPEAMAACWAPGGIDHFVGQEDLVAPDGVRDYFTGLFAAFPDFAIDLHQLTTE